VLFGLIHPSGIIEMRTADYRIRLDPGRRHVGRTILRRGGFDRVTTDHFRASIRPGMLVVDVGANVGHYTLVAAAAMRGAGEVRSYEPEPKAFAELEANVLVNRFKNVTLRQSAVWDVRGTAALAVDAINEGGHSLAAGNTRRSDRSVRVATVTLDEECGGREIGMLKIDAQGAEGRILTGAREVLRRGRPTVYLEFWPYGLRRCGSDPVEVLSVIRSCGFGMRVIERRRDRIRDLEPGEIDRVAASQERRVARDLLLEKT
jgi:FkbM family methyltransferase